MISLIAGCGGGSPATSPPPSGAVSQGTGEPVKMNPDDFIKADVTYLDKEWDLDPDVLGHFTFTFTTHEPFDSHKNLFCREWADMIYQATRGGVEIVNYPSNTLVSVADALPATQMGTVNLAWTIGPQYVDQFPILGIFNYAMLGLDAPTLAAEVMWDMLEENEHFYNELFNDEYVRFLLLYSTGGTGIHGNVPIRTLDDFHGLNIRVLPGTGSDMVQRLGASPISMGPGDMYDALNRGVLDAYSIDWTGIKSYRAYEVTKWYSTDGLWQTPMMIIINNNSWNSLPPEYQEVINYYSGRNMSVQHAWMWEWEVHEEQQILATPDQFITFSDEDWGKLNEMGREYNLERIKTVHIPGFDAEAFLARIYELAQQYLDDGYVYYQRFW